MSDNVTEAFAEATQRLEAARAKIDEHRAAIEEAEQEEQAAAEEIQGLVERLGLTRAQSFARQRAATGGSGSKTQQLIDALPGTMDQLVRESGLEPGFISATLARLQKGPNPRARKAGKAPGADGRMRNVYDRA